MTDAPNAIIEDIAALLRGIATGAITVHAEGETWDEVYAGNVTFVCSTGDRLVVFNDCDSLDYIDAAQLRDGRIADFDDWADTDPSWSLSEPENEAVYRALKAATS